MRSCARCGQELAVAFRFCPSCGAAASETAADERESRKVVTALFCDVVGSTSLAERTDAETVRRVMLRYFDAMRSAVERHGGTVDKFIGDAVMAAFGVPVAHEDDALRAVRAAVDMRRSLAEVNRALERDWSVCLEIRIGINTGEALTAGMVQGQTIVLGDSVNVAARLQQAALSGGIVLGAETVRVIGDAAEVRALPPLEAKGKAAPLQVFELVDLVDERPRRPHAPTPLVAREGELDRLLAAFEEAVRSRSCRLVAVTGVPGIGKSRLADELSRRLAEQAGVHSGRCPSYGEGITLRPLAQVAHDLAGEQLHSGVRELLGDVPDADLIATRVAVALGEASSVVAAQEETFWAFRRVFETVAAQQPLVLIVDDLHWAQPMLLDLLEHLVGRMRDAPLLIVALGRPELLDLRAGWASGAPGFEVLRLEPLSHAASRALIDHLLPPSMLEPSVRRHVIDQAEGNPLFLEQLLAFVTQGDEPTLRMPPTIQALLAARLDRLPLPERDVCERAAVVGRVFTLQMLEGLDALGSAVTDDDTIERLVQQDLMRRERPEDRSFAFAHALIRDAAYDATPKQRRAVLHEQVAAQLEGATWGTPGEHHQVVGHHLDQAYRLARELGRPEERLGALRERAVQHLGAAGHRALDAADARAAVPLLRRAVELAGPDYRDRTTLLLDLVDALWMSDLPSEARRLIDALDAAGASEHEQALAHAARAIFVNRYGRERGGEDSALSEATGVLEAAGDQRGIARARWAAAMALALSGRLGEAESQCEAALVHARAAGDERMVTVLLSWLADYAPLGPLPVRQGLERCRRLLEELRGRPFGELSCCWGMAMLHAMDGDPSAARDRVNAGRVILDEVALGPSMAAWAAFNAGAVELLAGEARAAEDELRRAHAGFEELGQRPPAWQTAAFLARALCAQDRYEDAETWAVVGERVAQLDPAVGAVARGARARALAHLGRLAEAELAARDAVEAARRTDEISEQADTLTDLAEVLRVAGRGADAADALREAISLYEAKGNVAARERARSVLGELVGAETTACPPRPIASRRATRYTVGPK